MIDQLMIMFDDILPFLEENADLGPSNMWLVHAVCDHMQSSIWALSQNESPLHLFHAYAVLDRVDQINLPDTALIAD